MGDRCYTELVCRKSDYEATLHEYLPESEQIEPGIVQAWNSDANGGLLEEREAWAQAGIPFYGEHAPCVGAYEEAVFASDGKVHADTLGVAGQPVARMSRNLEYEMVDDEEARRYWNVRARAEQLIHKNGDEKHGDHSSYLKNWRAITLTPEGRMVLRLPDGTERTVEPPRKGTAIH